MHTYKRNEIVIFLAWFNVDALIIACNLSIQTVPALIIYERIIYNALLTRLILQQQFCVNLLFKKNHRYCNSIPNQVNK